MKTKEKIARILIPANLLTQTQIEDMKANAKKDGYTKIEFIAEPMIGAYLTINL